MSLGTIKTIKEVYDLKLGNTGQLHGKKGSRLGMSGMFNSSMGYEEYDGYKVETTKKTFYVLIANGQCCCENWGYLSTNDNIQDFVGKEISKFSLTDTNLSNKEFKELDYLDTGGVQFVTFYMTDGEILQLAVYNSHNGYYGHSVLIAEDDKILLQDTL